MPDRTIRWARVGDHYADLAGEADHFLALDGETGAEVGVVKLVPTPAGGQEWMWSMLLVHPGPAFRQPTNGRCATRAAAARELVDCWWAFREWFGLDKKPPPF